MGFTVPKRRWRRTAFSLCLLVFSASRGCPHSLAGDPFHLQSSRGRLSLPNIRSPTLFPLSHLPDPDSPAFFHSKGSCVNIGPTWIIQEISPHLKVLNSITSAKSLLTCKGTQPPVSGIRMQTPLWGHYYYSVSHNYFSRLLRGLKVKYIKDLAHEDCSIMKAHLQRCAKFSARGLAHGQTQ